MNIYEAYEALKEGKAVTHKSQDKGEFFYNFYGEIFRTPCQQYECRLDQFCDIEDDYSYDGWEIQE